eukprot:353710-Chlamydomonas_euryale.AAC.6
MQSSAQPLPAAPLPHQVENFRLLPIANVAKLVAETDEFKTNCSLVIVDFMIRHGFVAPDAPGYLSLVKSMRTGDFS